MKLNTIQLKAHLKFLQTYYFFMWQETKDDSWFDKKQQVIVILDQLNNLTKQL